MAERITDKHLRAVCDRINRITKSPMEPWALDTVKGKHVAQIGNYHISHAYGGVSLHRMVNDSGGVSSPLGYGHVPKRELYERMHAFICGIESAKEGTL